MSSLLIPTFGNTIIYMEGKQSTSVSHSHYYIWTPTEHNLLHFGTPVPPPNGPLTFMFDA